MKIAAASILVAVALALPARADNPHPYTATARAFSATYPYEVHEQADPEGGGTAAAFDPQGIMYMVGMSPADKETAKRPAKQQLDDGLAGAIAKVHGKL